MLASNSLMNADWYLMRASGVVSLILLTATFVMGIATFRRWRPGKQPRFVTASLHRSVALLSVLFVGAHVLSAVVDPDAVLGLVAVVVPFTAGRSALWVGLGSLSIDLIAVVIVTSLLRARIGARAWRAIHWAAYASWPLALAHSFGTGTDASSLWLRAVGISCVAAVGSAVVWRVGAPRAKHLEPTVVTP